MQSFFLKAVVSCYLEMKTCELREEERGFGGMSSMSASAFMDVFSAKVLRHHFDMPESIPSPAIVFV